MKGFIKTLLFYFHIYFQFDWYYNESGKKQKKITVSRSNDSDKIFFARFNSAVTYLVLTGYGFVIFIWFIILKGLVLK